MIQLHAAEACPFAERVRAVLNHLNVRCEVEAVEPAGRSPVLVDRRLRLFGAAVIGEYLAEVHGWPAAFAEDPAARARQRQAIAGWDATVAPALARSLADGGLDPASRKLVQAELKELAQTVQASGKQVGDLLSFHVAPHWARMVWLRDRSPLADLIGEWVDVKAWLDACVAQPAVRAALAPRDLAVARATTPLAAARQ